MSNTAQIGKLGAAACIAMAMAFAGCQDERGSIEAVEATTELSGTDTPRAGRVRLSGMAVEVSSVHADHEVDLKAVRAALRDAESAFLSCLDPDGFTGVVALRVSVDTDGTVSGVALQPTTTYGTGEARSCIDRIVSAMRFPTPETHERVELDLSLEVRTRYQNE